MTEFDKILQQAKEIQEKINSLIGEIKEQKISIKARNKIM
jgi:DNA-binding protein YbaB